MRIFIGALVVWNLAMLFALWTVHQTLVGCITNQLLIEDGNSRLVCANGDVMSAASSYYQGLALWWGTGNIAILGYYITVRRWSAWRRRGE